MRPDTPVAGFYQVRLVPMGPWCPVRLWYGPPADPVTGELLDRSPRWQATVRGELYDGDVITLWQFSAKRPITKGQHDYLVALAKHADKYEPEMPEAQPKQPIDLHKMRPVF